MKDFVLLLMSVLFVLLEVIVVVAMSGDPFLNYNTEYTNPNTLNANADYNYTSMSNDVPQGSTNGLSNVIALFTFRPPFKEGIFPPILAVIVTFINYLCIFIIGWVIFRLARGTSN